MSRSPSLLLVGWISEVNRSNARREGPDRDDDPRRDVPADQPPVAGGADEQEQRRRDADIAAAREGETDRAEHHDRSGEVRPRAPAARPEEDIRRSDGHDAAEIERQFVRVVEDGTDAPHALDIEAAAAPRTARRRSAR